MIAEELDYVQYKRHTRKREREMKLKEIKQVEAVDLNP